MTKIPLLLFPCGGNAWEALDCMGDQYEPIGFVDDDPNKQYTTHLDLPVYGKEAFALFPKAKVLAVQGSPDTYKHRQKVIESLGISPNRWATVLHPNTSISPHAIIGNNCLIMSGVVITANTIINDHVIILPLSVIHHDTIIGPYTCIGSQVVVAGHSQIGKGCYIGSGSNIINNISIGDDTLVGMGTNVIKDVPTQSKVVGNPARLLPS